MTWELVTLVVLMPFLVLVFGLSGITAILLYLWSRDNL